MGPQMSIELCQITPVAEDLSLNVPERNAEVYMNANDIICYVWFHTEQLLNGRKATS